MIIDEASPDNMNVVHCCAPCLQMLVLNEQHVKQVRGRKTDVGDSVWLARPSLVLPKRYRELRALSRHRRQAAEDRARFRNRAHKLVDRAGLRVGGVLSDIFGTNGRRILDGLAEGASAGDILAGLSSHVGRKRAGPEGVLSLELSPHVRTALKDLLDHAQLLQQIQPSRPSSRLFPMSISSVWLPKS